MKILVIGGGGREHALVWRLARDGHAVIAAPGNPGIEALAPCHPVAVGDLDGLVALASAEAVDLVVVGPEAPLVAGLADRLRAAGVPTFGPSASGARLEGSKVFSDPGGPEGLANVPAGQEEAVIESAEECPGECIFIEIA